MADLFLAQRCSRMTSAALSGLNGAAFDNRYKAHEKKISGVCQAATGELLPANATLLHRAQRASAGAPGMARHEQA